VSDFFWIAGGRTKKKKLVLGSGLPCEGERSVLHDVDVTCYGWFLVLCFFFYLDDAGTL